MVHQIRPVDSLRPLDSRGQLSRKRIAGALVLLILAALPFWVWWDRREPQSLAQTYLAGERGPGCIRIVIANDTSGSMYEFTRPRQLALAQLLEWSPRNLRGDDEIAVLAFSGTTYVAMPPAPVASNPRPGQTPGPTDGTSLNSLVAALQDLPESRCATSLMLLSDGVFGDLAPDEDSGRIQLRDAGVSNLYLLVPGKNIPIEPNWHNIYPYAPPAVFDGTNPDATGLVLGRTLATVTGQHLERR